MTPQELTAFEDSLAEEFNVGKIRYPVHLESGNERQLIRIFGAIKSYDWIFGSWRMHLKALLKGVPPEDLKAAVRRGESMALRFPDYKVYGSAIAGGIVPIALGTAMAMKRSRRIEHIWCFLGDMVNRSGIAHECMTYGANHDLPITWIVEDNGVSVCTPTKAVWGSDKVPHVVRYEYRSKWPHCGSGVRVNF